jgi:PDZ domain
MATLGIIVDGPKNRVTLVDPDMAGAKMGIQLGDALLEVNEIPSGNSAHFATLVTEADEILSVTVGRGSARLRLTSQGETISLGPYSVTHNVDDDWNGEGRKNLGKIIVADSADVENLGGFVSTLGILTCILTGIISLVILGQNNPLGFFLSLIEGLCIGVFFVAIGRHITLQSKTSRFLVKESLKDIMN